MWPRHFHAVAYSVAARSRDVAARSAGSAGFHRALKTESEPQRHSRVGLSFGPDVTRAFLERNGLDLVVRSHEVRDNGYEVEHGGSLITVFSAPNYCDAMGNKGAFIHLSAALEPKFTTYDAVPHPPLRPMAYASASPFGL